MRILVYIALVFSFFILLHKKKKKKKRERSCVQVLDRFSFEQESCVGARSHSDTSRSLQLGARFRERHSKVARVFVAGSRKIASERGLGARSKGRSRWERRYGSDTSESLAVSTKRTSKKLTRSDVLERHLEVAPAQSEVSRATLQGRSRFSRNTTRGNDSGATSPSDTLTSLPNRSR